MSDYKPITGEMRKYVGIDRGVCYMNEDSFNARCDEIDSVHAQLERENAALKAELDRVLGEQEEHAHTRGESITDELREYASTRISPNKGLLLAIADRIDVEHERQLEVLYRDMSDAEYVKLHKDTGGEYIHEYDKVDWRDHAGTWHENATVVAVCSDGCYVMYALDGMVIHVNKSDIRHYHAPTVEDVLREFALKVAGEECMTMRTGVVEEYASKLQLAGDAS